MLRLFFISILAVFVFWACSKKTEDLSFGSVSGNVIDGRTGHALPGAEILALDEQDSSATTDVSGNYTVGSIEANDHTLNVSASGYDSQNYGVRVSKNTELSNIDFIMFPTGFAKNKFVIVLTWADHPFDLDSHLYVPDGSPYYEIDYGHLGSAGFGSSPFAYLDLDDTDGNGPETLRIQMNGTGTYYGGAYRYYVHNYSQDASLTASNAMVRVYIDGVLSKTYQVPTTGSGIYWHVFDVSGSTFTDVNTLSATQPSTPP
jgi:uncharacterized protein YfaP (DUF2135 family)